MKFDKPHTLEEIATFLHVDYVGEPSFPILGMNEIHVVEKGDIVFVDHPKYYDKALQSNATTILINKRVACPEGKSLLISEDPFRDFNALTQKFNPFTPAEETISSRALIGEDTVIQPNVFIGENVHIGNHCVIHPNVVIHNNCRIGNNVIIHANTVLGTDAFYYKNRAEGFDRLLSGGMVIIEDNVDLGASCTIDRGVSGATIIGAGSKLDNQVHVGHDTVIGKKCLIAAQTGIAGCTIIEDEVTIWGQVGINSDVTVKKGAVLMGQAGVTRSVEKGIYFGTPAIEYRQKLREVIHLKNITKLDKK
ncbi:UDP-3-O-(3-hydroxymyristoyl)glucosamine N-acyltransferase [Tenacibaculum sp. SG-28]|uniref:UDP-3-O-(3-hydroxymyristoyl)glucosamine N-acyltransferase n=1 Tax=Tenacibaculum sp. SG-28 TaxID=754426 RepID=UPI000CF477B3|nr:UDP-3-O-(3-hydroxymyristoyl)glucosamine N-acyltransferase [Tenacibaculum sp. SG-28]PQJ23312.1 UDP-3-O-(3-hydroxymyristoyl)glucosamine N-acyltransferase [Tenacibaculum sp. SG-28]